jgi:hypothetical protein
LSKNTKGVVLLTGNKNLIIPADLNVFNLKPRKLKGFEGIPDITEIDLAPYLKEKPF